MGGDDNKRHQQPDAKETQWFGLKYGHQKHNEKAEWISNMTRDLEELEEGPKSEIYTDLLKTTLKKYQTGKRQAMMEYMVSDSRNSPSHSRQTSTRNEQMPIKSTRTRMDDHIDTKGPK